MSYRVPNVASTTLPEMLGLHTTDGYFTSQICLDARSKSVLS